MTLSRGWCMKSNGKLRPRHLLLLREKSLKIRPSKPDTKMEEMKPKNAGVQAGPTFSPEPTLAGPPADPSP